MKYQKLEQKGLLVGITWVLLLCLSWRIYADTYEDGRITVKHAELPIKKNGQHIQFDHPYELTGNVVTNVLSNVSYEEKGFLKKKGNLKVFQDDEIKKLVPLIIQAFSIATPKQAIIISSYSERFILTDQQNYCVLFMTDNMLNIVFSRIHMFQSYSESVSYEKKHITGGITGGENPTRMKRNRFWKVIPSAGQRLEQNHENWLLINLSDEIYHQPIVPKAKTVDEKIKQGTSDIDARLRKLEGMMGSGGVHDQPDSTIPEKEDSKSKVKNKLTILREMVSEGIVSEEDYDYKKAKLLREAMIDMSIKDQLREIKELKSEGLITEDDYNEKKKELLDQL
ncbi:MAG: SHOCT domain-containing protein [Candidatus Jettenia sp. CY-1]|nr:MAG: SHOCT domain-containing protein [Candidatus Jettenia sp. CY-1]